MNPTRPLTPVGLAAAPHDLKAAGHAAIQAWSATPAADLAALDPEGDFAKQHLLNPVVMRMLGDITGRRILDAGCGQGYFSRLLAGRGAHVVGLEPAEGLYRYTCEREAERHQGIELIRADLTEVDLEPAFDAVVANMVFMAIPDWITALRSCLRALKPAGQLVFSITHPCFEDVCGQWANSGQAEVSEYLADYVIERPTAPDFHRPLSTYLNAVTSAGCRIVEVAEPGLLPELVGDPGAQRRSSAPCSELPDRVRRHSELRPAAGRVVAPRPRSTGSSVDCREDRGRPREGRDAPLVAIMAGCWRGSPGDQKYPTGRTAWP